MKNYIRCVECGSDNIIEETIKEDGDIKVFKCLNCMCEFINGNIVEGQG